MDAAFFTAAHCRPRVFGLRLKELKVGHARLLFEFQSPYFTLDAEPEPLDLLIAVFVCAQEPNEARKSLEAWWFNLFIWLWSKRIAKCDMIEERDTFNAYMDAHREAPRLSPFRHLGFREEPKTPSLYKLIVILAHKLCQSWESIDRLPMRYANSLYYTWGDMEGTIALMSERQSRFMEWAKEQDRLKAERGKN